jgi:hypothetical protein
MRETPTKQLIEIEKAKPCMACNRPSQEIHFVRRSPGLPISKLKLHGVRTVAREILKCDRLCAECHYERMRGAVLVLTRDYSTTTLVVAEALTSRQAIIKLAEADPEWQARLARWREEDGVKPVKPRPEVEPPEGWDGQGGGGIPQNDPRWLP